MGCGGKSTTSNNVAVQDPLAPGTGGSELRRTIFDRMPGSAAFGAGERAVQAANSYASDPGIAQAMELQRNTTAGKFLNGSPYLDRALAPLTSARNSVRSIGQGALAAGQDAAAGVRSGFQKAGMSFGTGNQQAQQADQAAAAARMAEQQTGATTELDKVEAAARTQNYSQERENQNNSGLRMQQMATGKINALSEAGKAAMQPFSEMANAVRNLTGGTPVTTSSTQKYSPGAMDYIGAGIGAAGLLGA